MMLNIVPKYSAILLNIVLKTKNFKCSQIYWLGDLNYRLTEIDAVLAKQHIEARNYAPLIAVDQLGQQRRLGRVLQGFQEAEITFKPTYKYDPGTDNWDSRFINCIVHFYTYYDIIVT